MSHERLSMRNIREVLCLRWERRLPHRAIGVACGISPGTVSDYLQRAQTAALT